MKEHPVLRDLQKRAASITGSALRGRGTYTIRCIADIREIVAQAWYAGRSDLLDAQAAGQCWYVLHVDDHGMPSYDGFSGPYTRAEATTAMTPGTVLTRRESSRAGSEDTVTDTWT